KPLVRLAPGNFQLHLFSQANRLIIRYADFKFREAVYLYLGRCAAVVGVGYGNRVVARQQAGYITGILSRCSIPSEPIGWGTARYGGNFSFTIRRAATGFT